MRNIVNSFLILKSMIILLYLRRRTKKILLIDFDFTLVNDHFDWKNREYKLEHQIMDSSIIELIKNNKDYIPVIFTARGFRSKRYITEFTTWRDHFTSILNCGSTKSKIWIIQNYLCLLYENTIWIDDLRDVDFEKASFKTYYVENIPENVELIIWRK